MTPRMASPSTATPASRRFRGGGRLAGVNEQPGAVVRARPQRARVVCWAAAVGVVAVFTTVALALRGPTDGSGTHAVDAMFGVGDQIAMIGLGIIGAVVIVGLTRPRVEADATGIKVRNLVGAYQLPWEVVEAVRFDRGAPWASLILADDDEVAVMAVQATDRDYAVDAVRALRRLLAEHKQRAAGNADEPHGSAQSAAQASEQHSDDRADH